MTVGINCRNLIESSRGLRASECRFRQLGLSGQNDRFHNRHEFTCDIGSGPLARPLDLSFFFLSTPIAFLATIYPDVSGVGGSNLQLLRHAEAQQHFSSSQLTTIYSHFSRHPVYSHHEYLPWAHEPWKSLYVLQRVLSTLILVPFWILYYAILPRSFRPRPSWSLKQIVAVKFTKRIYRVTEVAGVTWGTRDPTTSPDESALRETRFVWVPPLSDELRHGIVDDKLVQCKKVGTYIWPKEPLRTSSMHCALRAEKAQRGASTSPMSSDGSCTSSNSIPSNSVANIDIEAAAAHPAPRMIGLYLHGGGYCHMSAHEHSGTSRIPRRLLVLRTNCLKRFTLSNTAFSSTLPCQLHYKTQPPSMHTSSRTTSVHRRAQTASTAIPRPRGPTPCPRRCPPTVVDIDSNPITEALRSANHPASLPCRSSATADEVTLGGNDALPAGGPRGGDGVLKPATRRPKVILIGDSAGGNLILALARWIRDQGVLPAPDGMLLLSPSCDPSHTLPQVPASYRPRPHASTDYLLDTAEPRAVLQRAFLGHHPAEMVYSPYISPASDWVLSVFHNTQCEGIARTNPFIRAPEGHGLFTSFPRALVVVGDAERLEREIIAMERGMERDGVRVRLVWVPDGVHDVLIMKYWDENVREEVWRQIRMWIEEVAREE
ncbi:hypothetical protein EW146_g4456 [Bondarzewia mesenterica]|uniref:Alpha/beta hydrolase fold-3 domain-containing protein n=1 Tax=Bondarzewia mesenterica TaxID=1095465 RepID=A0A4S4LV15_9AGAM|nr:hypothetical protein EW146_g4456 [Bondarzewia mesenterica]